MLENINLYLINGIPLGLMLYGSFVGLIIVINKKIDAIAYRRRSRAFYQGTSAVIRGLFMFIGFGIIPFILIFSYLLTEPLSINSLLLVILILFSFAAAYWSRIFYLNAISLFPDYEQAYRGTAVQASRQWKFRIPFSILMWVLALILIFLMSMSIK